VSLILCETANNPVLTLNRSSLRPGAKSKDSQQKYRKYFRTTEDRSSPTGPGLERRWSARAPRLRSNMSGAGTELPDRAQIRTPEVLVEVYCLQVAGPPAACTRALSACRTRLSPSSPGPSRASKHMKWRRRMREIQPEIMLGRGERGGRDEGSNTSCID
jgi:hypothetical protein